VLLRDIDSNEHGHGRISNDNEPGLLDTGSRAQATVRASLQQWSAVPLACWRSPIGTEAFTVYRLRVKADRQRLLPVGHLTNTMDGS
jgi:hypothetical protein